jgi:hypothetical protein
MFYCTWLRNVPADSISERVVFDELGEPVIGCLRRALERLEINVDPHRSGDCSLLPTQNYRAGTKRNIRAVLHLRKCVARGCKVVAQISDTIIVQHETSCRKFIVVAGAILSHIKLRVTVTITQSNQLFG